MGRLGRFLVVLGILVALLVGVEFGIRALVGSQLQEALTSTDLELEQPSVELGGLGGILAWYSLIHTDPDRLDPLLAEFARAVRPGGGLAIGFFEGPALVPFDHAVTTAYFWPADLLSAHVERAGFTVTDTDVRTDPGTRRLGTILARRTG
jgi:SAM-dependent methyltransferase